MFSVRFLRSQSGSVFKLQLHQRNRRAPLPCTNFLVMKTAVVRSNTTTLLKPYSVEAMVEWKSRCPHLNTR